MMILLMNCSGGSGDSSQEAETQSESTEAQSEPQEPSPALTQQMETGKTVYTQYCLACHQADGNGVKGAFPTLHQTEYVLGDKTELITIIINGLQGPIEVNGEQYNNVMPQHSFLTDEQIAGVLTYVRKSFGNDAEEITAEEVKEVRDDVAADTTGTSN